MVQHCKETLTEKSDRREKAKERRNFAYYHHKRYNKIIQKLKTEDLSDEQFSITKEEYEHKEQKHLRNWNKLNKAFEEGHLYLRPTTKTVADLMGICERQVNYYINCAKKEICENQLKKVKESL